MMGYVITGLDRELFGSLFKQTQAELATQGFERHLVTEKPGFPCRISLDDAEIGETVLLVRYAHAQGKTPYAQSGPIFVSEASLRAGVYRDRLPPALARRNLSLRAFNKNGAIIDAALCAGMEAEPEIERLFANPDVTHIDAHNAARGCFAAKICRA